MLQLKQYKQFLQNTHKHAIQILIMVTIILMMMMAEATTLEG